MTSSLSTHSWLSKLMALVLLFIRSLSAVEHLAFVIASAGLYSSLIQYTCVISHLSYSWGRHIRSIIYLFSLVVPSFTRHSYRDLESVHIIRGICMPKIFSTLYFMVAPELKLFTIAYSSIARTLIVIFLHFVEDQWRIFARFSLSASTIAKPIWDERSLFFAKDESAKTIIFNDFISSLTNFNHLDAF